MQFQKNKDKDVIALIDLRSKENVMILTYRVKLSFKTRKTNIRAQKIDGLLLKIYSMAIVTF